MIVLDENYVNEHLDTGDCIALMEKTLKQEEEGGCVQYMRTAINMPNHNILGLMPAYFEEGYFGAKILSVYLSNHSTGYPSHQGQILLFEKEYGQVIACVDAMSVTKIRTGAVSAAASRYLARPDSRHLAILGCGVQGESHLAAISRVFPLEQVSVWDLYPDTARRFAERCQTAYGLPVTPYEDAALAVKDADIICTVTPSSTPVLKYSWLKPGVHINAVGACSPQARELDGDITLHASFFGDSVESVMKESGDFLIPLHEGLIQENHLKGTIGQIMNGKIQGRTTDDEITVFEALGMAVEDIACAALLYRQAKQ